MSVYINLKTIFPTDSQEVVVEKSNYNFNQLLDLGIGKPGGPGTQGNEGPTGIDGTAGRVGHIGSQIYNGTAVPNDNNPMYHEHDQYIRYSLPDNIFEIYNYNYNDNSSWSHADSPINIFQMIDDLVNAKSSISSPFKRNTGHLTYVSSEANITGGTGTRADDTLILSDFYLFDPISANLASLKAESPLLILRADAGTNASGGQFGYNMIISALYGSTLATSPYLTLANSLKIAHKSFGSPVCYSSVFDMIPKNGNIALITSSTGFEFWSTHYTSVSDRYSVNTYIGSASYMNAKFTGVNISGIATTYNGNTLVTGIGASTAYIHYDTNGTQDTILFSNASGVGSVGSSVTAMTDLGNNAANRFRYVYANGHRLYIKGPNTINGNNWWSVDATNENNGGNYTSVYTLAYRSRDDAISSGIDNLPRITVRNFDGGGGESFYSNGFSGMVGINISNYINLREHFQINEDAYKYVIGSPAALRNRIIGYAGYNINYMRNISNGEFRLEAISGRNGGVISMSTIEGDHYIVPVKHHTEAGSYQFIDYTELLQAKLLNISPTGIGLGGVYYNAHINSNTEKYAVNVYGSIAFSPYDAAQTQITIRPIVQATKSLGVEIWGGTCLNNASINGVNGGHVMIVGGNAEDTTSKNIGGIGGSVELYTANGGYGIIQGGQGGSVIINPNNGGHTSSSYIGGSQIGGAGGDIILSTNYGGFSFAIAGANNIAGRGGNIILTAAIGGNASYGIGGAGGEVGLIAGPGGKNVSNVFTTTYASGGDVSIQSGDGGTNSLDVISGLAGNINVVLGKGTIASPTYGKMNISKNGINTTGYNGLVNIYGTAVIDNVDITSTLRFVKVSNPVQAEFTINTQILNPGHATNEIITLDVWKGITGGYKVLSLFTHTNSIPTKRDALSLYTDLIFPSASNINIGQGSRLRFDGSSSGYFNTSIRNIITGTVKFQANANSVITAYNGNTNGIWSLAVTTNFAAGVNNNTLACRINFGKSFLNPPTVIVSLDSTHPNHYWFKPLVVSRDVDGFTLQVTEYPDNTITNTTNSAGPNYYDPALYSLANTWIFQRNISVLSYINDIRVSFIALDTDTDQTAT